MSRNDLPSTVEAFQALVLSMHEELTTTRDKLTTTRRVSEIADRKMSELTATVERQRVQLEKQERQIPELIPTQRGKQREKIDPNQLLLFEVVELEQVIEEQLVVSG